MSTLASEIRRFGCDNFLPCFLGFFVNEYFVISGVSEGFHGPFLDAGHLRAALAGWQVSGGLFAWVLFLGRQAHPVP